MSRRKYDVCARVGEYTDREGNTKAKWQNVGVVLQTENGHCLLLEQWFNPAGVASREPGGAVMLSLFEPKAKGERQESRREPEQAPADPDDAIPF